MGVKIIDFFVSETLLVWTVSFQRRFLYGLFRFRGASWSRKGCPKGAEMEQKSLENSTHVRHQFRMVIFELSGDKMTQNGAKTVPETLPRNIVTKKTQIVISATPPKRKAVFSRSRGPEIIQELLEIASKRQRAREMARRAFLRVFCVS